MSDVAQSAAVPRARRLAAGWSIAAGVVAEFTCGVILPFSLALPILGDSEGPPRGWPAVIFGGVFFGAGLASGLLHIVAGRRAAGGPTPPAVGDRPFMGVSALALACGLVPTTLLAISIARSPSVDPLRLALCVVGGCIAVTPTLALWLLGSRTPATVERG